MNAPNPTTDTAATSQRTVSVRTYEWLDKTHEITRPDIDDVEVARRVRMVTSSDLDHEFVCVLGRDRIMALVKEKEALLKVIAEVAGLVEVEATICDHVGAKGSAAALSHSAVRLREALSSH